MKWRSIIAALFLVLVLGIVITDLGSEKASSAVSIRWADVTWLWSTISGVRAGEGESPALHRPVAFGPNISVCYPSFSDRGAPVFCCPPIPDASQQVVDFVLPNLSSAPVRIRRAAHLITDEDYIAKYERAVALMKQLPFSHPHNFLRQANMHCLYCTGSYHQLNSEHLFEIHESWYFFPWHRAFLYFHERILGKLIGDDSFAVPYWQWDHPDGMYIPDIFLHGSLDHRERDSTHLPPKVTDDNYKFVERGLSSDEQISYNLAFMYTQMVSGAKKPELFMGCKLRPGKEDMCHGPGTIESALHNTVHAWVGSGHNPEREDMGAFYAAARDPVFYAHHSNIDRLWLVWKDLHGNKPEIVDDLWLNTHFYFYDENLVLNRVKVRDFLDISKLGYRYEDTQMPWLSARPQPAVDLKIAREIIKRRTWSSVVANANPFSPNGTVLDRTMTVEVLRQRRRAGTRKLKEEDEEEVLVVYGIETREDVYTKFSVYVNMVDEVAVLAAGSKAREFAGTFVGMRRGVKVVRKEGCSSQGVKTELKLGISDLLKDLEAEEDDTIWVSMVPEGGTGTNVVVGGVRVEYMGYW